MNYYFIRDQDNLQRFLNGQEFYLFKRGNRIITEVVYVKIVAVKLKPKFEVRTVRRPEVRIRVVPR